MSNKKNSRNWVNEYNKASSWSKHQMEYEKQWHERTVRERRERVEANEKAWERRQFAKREEMRRAFEMLTPQEQADYIKHQKAKDGRRKGILGIFLGFYFGLLYHFFSVMGIVLGVIGLVFLRLLYVSFLHNFT